MVLAGGTVSLGSAARFATVGVLGVGIDFFAFMILLATGAGLMVAHVASFVVATIFNYALNSRWSFAESRHISRQSDWGRYARFLTICLLALFLRGGILATAVIDWNWPPKAAILLAIASAAIVNYLGSAFFIFPPVNPSTSRSVRWRVLALGVLAYVVLLRFVFLGNLNLLPEEAYYWNYSQHLDIGYLDHPPMVAWIIWLGTQLAGNTEFGVRIGASISWMVAAFFCFQLTRNLYGKTAAFVAILMFCMFPFFFATGLLMTPDAPLTASWAGVLYFLERALLGERREAWLGVGLCVGLGMLSKYTIALLGPATLLFLLLDPGLRRWLWQPWPYLAVLIATLVFSPVILWNVLNDWASLSFQGVRRLHELTQFSLHMLIGSVLVLLTPVGLIAVARTLFARGSKPDASWLADRATAFIAIYTLVPLSAFVAFSVFHEVRLNWTGPIWLAVLPALARRIVTAQPTGSWIAAGHHRPWLATLTLALLTYGAVLHYFVLGLPGIGPNVNASLKALPIGWKEFGTQIEKIETDLENATGKEPLRVGMDRYFLSSEIAFYDPDQDAVPDTAGRSLFGFDSLMYDRWFPSATAKGRDILLVSRESGGRIAAKSLSERFETLGPILEHIVSPEVGAPTIRFFYRFGYNYIPTAVSPANTAGARVETKRRQLGTAPISVSHVGGKSMVK